MRKLIFIILLASTGTWANNLTLVKPDDSWTIDHDWQIGAKTRIPATNQNPLPFCFSTAAAMLYDQTRCMNSVNCSNQSQTSFLAITSSGQDLKEERLSTIKGGSPIKSLVHLVNSEPVQYSQCNYELLTNNNSIFHKFNNELKYFHSNWKKYKLTAPYLSRYYKYEFISIISAINNSVDIDSLLTEELDLENIAYRVLVRDSCLTKKQNSAYTVKFIKVDVDNLKQAKTIIDTLLKQKKPVIVNFCPTIGETKCNSSSENLHSFIIIAKTMAVHKITMDKRMVYWVVNSWGEEWQAAYRDGWIYSDRLLENLVGEIIWLEKK